MAPNKRAHKTLTLSQKKEILQQIKDGVSNKTLAVKYGVGSSTISDIKNAAGKINRFMGNCLSVSSTRKTLKQPKFPKMEHDLFAWFLTQKERNAHVSTEIVCQKAMHFYIKHYGNNEEFTASRGWINKFRKRHGIGYLKESGEKLSPDETKVKPSIVNLPQVMKDYDLKPSQVYSVQESVLFWKLLPDKTLHHSSSFVPDRKTNREQVTFLVCSNADGSNKLKVMVIGKSENPRSFKNGAIPVDYYNTKDARINTALFKEWFDNSFVPQVREFSRGANISEDALLIIDYGANHALADLCSNDANIFTMFFPTICTSLIQCMDQNVVTLIKIYYRKSLLTYILSNTSEDLDDNFKIFNAFTLKDAVYLLSDGWEKVPSAVISKCWHNMLSGYDNMPSDNIGNKYDDIHDSEDEQRLGQWRTVTIKEENGYQYDDHIMTIVDILNQIGQQNVMELDVVEWVNGDENQLRAIDCGVVSEVEEEDILPKPPIKHQEAVRSFNICLQWSEENNVEASELMHLRRLREKAFDAQNNTIRQTKITDYFK